ncbi:MAG: hypothetical protein K0B11_14300 [Mariniphaga sp.]|nr:hypothetical protein [Mariniphaga sp.]
MKLKIKAALFFLLLANTILLAHAAISHQHMAGLVEFIDHHHSHAHNKAHHHDEPESNNDVSGHEHADFCLLSQSVHIPRNEIKFNIQENANPGFDGFISLTNIEVIKPHFFNISPPFHDFKLTLYAVQICNGHGLRAPPVV